MRFEMGGQSFGCVASFALALRYPQDSEPRARIAAMIDSELKQHLAERGGAPADAPVYWQGQVFGLNSAEHRLLMKEAVAAAKRAAGEEPAVRSVRVRAQDPETGRLFPSARCVFELDGQGFRSFCAFVTATLFEEGSSARFGASLLSATEVVDYLSHLHHRPEEALEVRWEGARHEVGSPEALALYERALRAVIATDPKAREQLVATGGALLTLPGEPRVIRRNRFVGGAQYLEMLTAIRADLLASRRLEPHESVVNIGSNNARASLLSNFAATGFEIDGMRFASAEAFIQYVKFPDGDSRRTEIPAMVAGRAKRAGEEINKEIVEKRARGEDAWVQWRGQKVRYRSPAHMALIERALRAKFAASPDAMRQLRATRGARLTHRIGHRDESPHTSLPAAEFCRILTAIRDEADDAGAAGPATG